MTIFTSNTLQLIHRPKEIGIGLHYGALLPDGRAIDFSPKGIRVCTLEEFKNGHSYTVEKEVTYNNHVNNRLHQLINGRVQYNFLNFNCENFARFLAEDKNESTQVNGLLILCIAALFAFSLD